MMPNMIVDEPRKLDDTIQNIFRLRASGFNAARGYLASFWDDALTAFQQAAEDAAEADR